MRRVAVVVAVGVMAGLFMMSNLAWAECSAENWKDCAGKPWVDGEKMDTPLGTKWWPQFQIHIPKYLFLILYIVNY